MSTSHEPRLQIDPRCIKCGKVPAAETALLEMQNHLYICNDCRQEEERKGKRIAWAGGETLQPPAINTPPEQSVMSSAPSNSIFVLLGVSLNATPSEVEVALAEKMRYWMFEPDAEEKEQMIELLRTWQEELINDPQFLEKQRTPLQPSQPRGSALTIGDQQVYTAQEFIAACEASKEGWQDGELLLRKGDLQHWILFQLENRTLAGEVHRMARARASDFRLLNHVLYRLSPERPFRLYAQESWEHVSEVPQATTLTELAQICDRNWERAEQHLYSGAMLLWLEQAKHCQSISEYYRAHIKGYQYDRYKRGLGLELLLERVVPQLPRPELVVSFDGIKNQFELQSWDRELPHKPITLRITNTTRGFTSLTLEILKPESSLTHWLHLEGSGPPPPPLFNTSEITRLTKTASLGRTTMPIPVNGRPGAGMPARQHINMVNLETLDRGKTYRQVLRLTEWREDGRTPSIREYPITISTMTYFQGFRGKLWLWGLRGDLPGFAWNFAAGSILAALVILLMFAFAFPVYTVWQDHFQREPMTFGTAVGTSIIGTVDLLRQLHVYFVLMVGLLTGSIGAYTGIGKGHMNYRERQSTRIFKKVVRGLILPIFIALVIWEQNHLPANINSTASFFWVTGGSLLVSLFTLLIIYAITLIRVYVERDLRLRYADLLNPPGKE